MDKSKLNNWHIQIYSVQEACGFLYFSLHFLNLLFYILTDLYSMVIKFIPELFFTYELQLKLYFKHL